MTIIRAGFSLTILTLSMIGCGPPSRSDEVSPAGAAARSWATPIKLAGVPNLAKVSDELYRGDQPTDDGYRNLASMGITTVINLRLDGPADKVRDAGLAYEEISMIPWDIHDREAIRFLKIVISCSRGPFFVHCLEGADRTGALVAVYRIVVQGWSRAEAVAEMTRGPYGFNDIWQNITNYIMNLDVAKLRREAGMPVMTNQPVPASTRASGTVTTHSERRAPNSVRLPPEQRGARQ